MRTPFRTAAALAVILALGPALSACATLRSIDPFVGPAKPTGPLPSQMSAEDLYNSGVDLVRARKWQDAAARFELVQQNYPYSPWASDSQLLEGYSYYQDDDYTNAIGQLDHYIQLHPANDNTPYAYYLRALCYYEQIADIQRDQRGTVLAMAQLQEVVNRYPDTPYARDAALKIDLCRDHLAGKEMLIGRYYERQHFYEAAINRYQRVVQDFQTTNHVAEALERLTECYLKLGLVDEARRSASVLGYNYPGSRWYALAYADLQQVHGENGMSAPRGARSGGFLGIF